MNLENGRSVDMLTGVPPVFDESSRLSTERDLLTDHHWVDYYRALVNPARSPLKYALGYYCAQWNDSHPTARARSIVAHLGIERTYPPTHETSWRKDQLQVDCPR
jgi:hypothetical protein